MSTSLEKANTATTSDPGKAEELYRDILSQKAGQQHEHHSSISAKGE